MTTELTLDELLNTELQPLDQIADKEATQKKYASRFEFDPSVSLASEIELKRQEEIQRIKIEAQKQKATENFINQNESNARIGAADVDSLNGVAESLNSLNGVKNLSMDSMESNLVNINASKLGGVFKGMAKDVNQNNQLTKSVNQGSTFNQLKSFDPAKKPESKIEPIKNNGNKYVNSVKRGAASIIQLGSLAYDGGYEAFERGADLVTGWDVNGHVPYKTNKVFNVMAELKADKYQQSNQLNNVLVGADLAGKQAEENGESPLAASTKYLLQNGSFGDAGELVAEFVPSLLLGGGLGGAAERGAATLAERYVATKIGQSIATNSIINPTRLAAIQVVAPKAIQGAVMAGAADFSGSLAPEVEAQIDKGYSEGEAVNRAIKKSLAQAAVSAAGGSLLPVQMGGDFTTVLGQSAIQGLFGYGSAEAGARAIGEDLSSTEGALNILLGAVTALPEVLAVGGLNINKADVQSELNDAIADRAIADTYQKQEVQDTRSVYFGAAMRELLNRVKSSKTNERSPETLREFVRNAQLDEMDAPSEVYIDAETFNQLNIEHNIDVESLLESSPELFKNYQLVNDIDGMIRVPLDELLTAFSKVDNEQYLNAFSDSLRHHPEALTAAEAKIEFAKNSEEMKADIQQIKEVFEKEKESIKQLESVAEIIKSDLDNLKNSFGGGTEYNKLSSTLVSSFYESLAEKSGMPAMQLYNAMPLRVVSDQDQANAILGGVDSSNFSQSVISKADPEIAALNKNDFQKHLKEKYSINLGLIEDKANNSISIEKIIVPDDSRQSGTGTSAMNEIVAYANSNGKKLTLTPSSDFGGNKKRLTEFYKRFGFVENKGKNKDHEISDSMYRLPESIDTFNQKFMGDIRGQIQFRTDKKGAVIILGKNADFSTFAHELGHHFLEMSMSFASRPDAPEQLKTDMIKVMEWSKQGKGIEDWKALTPEQKTEVHEKFAETFEQYMFTGKAPSNELRKVFSRFRSFMASVYKNIEKFLGIQTRADLNPEIRDVMDRMLATQEAIEQVQRQRNLEFTIAQDQAMAIGISPKDYLDMVEDHKAATEEAINQLEQNTLKDLARYRTLRNKHIKAFSEQQKRIRQQVRETVAEEVAAMPVYQVLAFLRQPVERVAKPKRDPNVVDTKVDTLLDAIAKMGGINAKEIESTWGTDQPESYKVNVGRVKKVARKDGLSIKTVAERLAEDGYLSTDENGKFDTREFEDLFTDSLAGGKYYSREADPELFMQGEDYGLAMNWIDEFPASGKLNIEWLKAHYGEESEIYKAVAKTGQYGLAMKEGLDPDLVASQFGYASADAMIKEMATSPTPKELIEERANGIIQAQYSDLFDTQSMEMAIDEAVHNDIRAMMLARELTAITRLQGRQSEFNAAAKSVAQNIIDNSLVDEIRPHLFSAAELKHGKNYDKAIKAGNTLDAVRAKRQQLINFHATKQAYEANKFVDKLFTLAKTINGDDSRIAKNRDFNIVTAARFILARYGVIDLDVNIKEQLIAIRDYDPLSYLEIKDLSGLYVGDDGEYRFDQPINKVDYREMTYTEFQTLNDIVRQLWHKSKESQKITVGDKKVEFTKAVDDLIIAMDKKPQKSRAESFLGYTPRSAKDFNPQRAFQSLKRAEQLFSWLDGGKSNGKFHEYIFNPMQDALATYRLEQKKMMQSMVNIYSEFDVYHGKIDATELGGDKTTFESKQELLHAILHTGNESNKKRLVLGYGWGEKLDDGSVDYAKFDNFLSRIFDEGIVTKKDMDAIQKIWTLFDGYKEQAQKTHKNLNGLYFKELPKSPINTPFGIYEGGYIPADYDRLLSVDAEQRGKQSQSTQENQFFNSGASTGANFTKSRVEAYNGDYLALDLTALPMHLDRELRYIHLEENLKQASKLFRNKNVMKNLESVSPFAIDSIISDWLGAVANQRVSKASDYPTLDRFVEKLKQNSGIVLMAGNFKNAIEAWTSLPQLTVAVPKKELASTTAKYFTNAFSRESMTKQVRELSPFMDSRLDNVANEMRYQLENIVTNPSKLKIGTDFLRNNAYYVQQVFQVPLETIGWMSAFNDSQAKGMSEADAIHHADGVVRQYLNDMSPEGISKVERGNPLMRAMLMFYGWFNMVHNTWSMNSKLIKENPDLSKLQKMGKHAGLYMLMIAMPAMLSKALTLSFNGELFNNEDQDDWNEDLINITAKSQAEMIFGMLPFARDVINPIYRTTFDATIYSDRYSISPIQSMGENLIKLGKDSAKIAENTFADGENEIDKSKVTKEILQGATFATGIPFTLVQRPATYATDVLIDEDQEPKNIPDAIRGTINGR